MSGWKPSAQGAILKFFNRRRIFLTFGALVIALLALIGVVAAYLRSDAFQLRARQYIAEQIARKTGLTASVGDFRWSLLRERFVLEDLTLRGLEPPQETPLAHIRRIEVGLNLRTLFEHRIDLSDITITQPEFHLVVRPDGQTNVPTPPRDESQQPFQFSVSVRTCRIADGSALVNEQRINMDFSVLNLA